MTTKQVLNRLCFYCWLSVILVFAIGDHFGLYYGWYMALTYVLVLLWGVSMGVLLVFNVTEQKNNEQGNG